MKSVIAVMVLSLLFGLTGSASAQEKSKSSNSKDKEGKIRGVLPSHYGQLNLSQEQRQTIYKIQNEYADKIEDLQKKIEEVKAERNAKYLKTLTKGQRERLDEIKKGSDKEDKNK